MLLFRAQFGHGNLTVAHFQIGYISKVFYWSLWWSLSLSLWCAVASLSHSLVNLKLLLALFVFHWKLILCFYLIFFTDSIVSFVRIQLSNSCLSTGLCSLSFDSKDTHTHSLLSFNFVPSFFYIFCYLSKCFSISRDWNLFSCFFFVCVFFICLKSRVASFYIIKILFSLSYCPFPISVTSLSTCCPHLFFTPIVIRSLL